jgi:hypothetical protein
MSKTYYTHETKLLTVTVKPEHIEKGKPCTNDSCAIALAIKEVVPARSHVSISRTSAIIGAFGHGLPESAKDFIKLFDKGIKPEPFTFQIKYK